MSLLGVKPLEDNVEKKKYMLTANAENGIIVECHKDARRLKADVEKY